MVESTRWWIFHHIVDKLTDVMIMMSLFMGSMVDGGNQGKGEVPMR